MKTEFSPPALSSVRKPLSFLQRYPLGILAVLTLIGAALRFWNLGAKPPWTDEFATWVFSLGNDFTGIPGGEILTGAQLLAPLRFNQPGQWGRVIELLVNQDNHPPLYFLLAHFWQGLFPQDYQALNITVGRSLAALAGTLLIPLSYVLARWLWTPSLALALALLTALSPYGVFISQESRHYTLAVLWITLSLGCCLKASQYFKQGQPLPRRLVLAWVLVNALALSTHFFTGLFILAEFLGLAGSYQLSVTRYQISNISERLFGISSFFKLKCFNTVLLRSRLLPVLLGSLTAALVWGWVISQRDYGHGMTQWMALERRNFLNLLGPPVQLLAAWVTIFTLLPVESPNLTLAIAAGLGMLAYVIFLLPRLKRGLDLTLTGNWRSEARLLLWITGSLLALYFAVTYGAGMDITRGARYSFNFFPLLIFLAALALVSLGQTLAKPGRLWALVILMGLASAVTVTHNLGYQKYYRPELFLAQVDQVSPPGARPLIVTTRQSLVQTGEMMGLALEARRRFPQLDPRFALIPQRRPESAEATAQLKRLLEDQDQSIDLWLVNFLAPQDLPQCQSLPSVGPSVNGYSYRRFLCPAPGSDQLNSRKIE
ncbi:MAG: hypothetical protein GC158_16080 [Cyanobacteria bacterium RI_101]|nr:hypothetical protein [Cyanobacteria bacterium RI_101]